jgi:hypothetical protein
MLLLGAHVIGDPDWTERADKRGLDPLGMQNAGVALYQSLLPGLSNVTLRMRYYGYYCWVSDAYARSDATDDFRTWQSWVRRAEALYALVAARAGGEGGVGGVEWADARLALGEEVIDFAEAASIDKEARRYLRQPLGVFGGAYYSQMVELGLFRQGDHGVHRATNGLGRQAADAFRASIGVEVEQLLLEAIRTASVTRANLERLNAIVPSRIPEPSPERELYERLLFGRHEGTRSDASRAASLQLILATADGLGARPDPDQVRWHLFDLPPIADERMERQRVRWEAYQCHDLFQVAAAALLDWSMDLMAETEAGLTPAEMEEKVRNRLASLDTSSAASTWSGLGNDIEPDTYHYRETWSRLTSRRGTAEQKAWDAIHLIAALGRRLTKRPTLLEVVGRELAPSGGGRSIMTELRWFHAERDAQVGNLIARYVVERIVRRHSWVAMQKLRRQRDYTFLVEVHDGRWLRRGAYAPVATTPRLGPAVQFLADIHLVAADGPTARGRAVLGADA